MTARIVTVAGRQYELHVEREGSRFRAGAASIELLSLRGDEAEIRSGDRLHVVPFAVDGTRVSFAFDGEIFSAEVAGDSRRTRARQREHSMSAPMPGVVLKILVAQGAVVTRGTPLLILEAMKMEHQIVAAEDGVVAAVNCSEGQMVEPGVDLVELQPSEP